MLEVPYAHIVPLDDAESKRKVMNFKTHPAVVADLVEEIKTSKSSKEAHTLLIRSMCV